MSIRDLVPWLRGEERTMLWPRGPFVAFERELERPFGLGRMMERELAGVLYTPPVDVKETEQEVQVIAELPGLEKGDIEIWVESNHLMFSGEKKSEREKESGSYYSRERFYGSFTRMIPLPCEVNFDKVEATFKNGILTVTMPKTEEAKRHHKKIEIQSE